MKNLAAKDLKVLLMLTEELCEKIHGPDSLVALFFLASRTELPYICTYYSIVIFWSYCSRPGMDLLLVRISECQLV